MITLIDFITESNAIEGVFREPVEAEIQAHRDILYLDTVKLADISNFVWAVAEAPLRGKPGRDVMVGHHYPPDGGPAIRDRMHNLFGNMNSMTPFEFHVMYETIHPFMDGNGRSGRVLWLYMMLRGPWGSYSIEHGVPRNFLQQFYYQTLDAS